MCYALQVDLAMFQGQYDQARVYIEQLRAIGQKTGKKAFLVYMHWSQAYLARVQGNTQQARQHAQECLKIAQEASNPNWILEAINELGQIALQQDDLELAGTLLRECLPIVHNMHNLVRFPYVIMGLAGLASRLQANERVARLFGVLDHYCRGLAYALAPIERTQFEADQEAARAALGEARFRQSFEAGREMSVEQALAYAEKSD